MANEIKNAVKALGCNKGTLTINRHGYDTVVVKVNGSYFGLYDVCRHTFVD